MAAQIENIDLHIAKAKNGYTASIKDDAGKTCARHAFKLQVDRYILATLEDRIGKDIKETSQLVRTFGRELYNAVFGGEIAGYYTSLVKQKKDIRLRLVFKSEDGELLRIPWEFLFDGTNFLSAYPRLTMLRTLDGASGDNKGPIKGKIRVLAVVSSPTDLKDLERLNFEQEQMLIMEAVDRPNASNQIEIDFLDEASLKNIGDRLDEEEYHILHYTGHGAYSEKEDKGYLLLEAGDGKKREVDNETIANLLAGHKSLRLVVLSGCQTAKTSGRRALSDMATPLLLGNIPAVIAMQYSVSDSSAMALARKLYLEIGNGVPIDAALVRARKELTVAGGLGEIEFATPVLYSSDPDCLAVEKEETGRRFDKKIEIKSNIVLGIAQLGRQFVGRRRELRRIKEGYLERGIRVVVLHGIGGIGKTVTASKIADMLKDHLDGIYTFDCREDLTAEKILMQCNEFFKRFGITQLEEAVKAPAPIEAKIDFLAQALSQIKLLVIFDNFETQLSEEKGKWEISNPDLKKALKTLVTQCKDGTRFLFTSRYTFNLTDARLTNLVEEINLDQMSRPEAIVIMNRSYDVGREDIITKNKIYDKLGGHPYYINLFAKHAAATSVDAVLADLAGVQRDMVDFTLLDKSYRQLSDRAGKLLDSAAVFRKALPLSGFEWVMKENDKPVKVESELGELGHWGLIIKVDESEDPQYQVHTLVKEFIRSNTDGAEWKNRLIKAAQYYEGLFQTTYDIWDHLESRDLYFVAGEYNKAGDMVASVSEMLHTWGLSELVLSLNEQSVASTSGPSRAAALNNLGNVYYSQGDYDRARKMYSQSLDTAKELGDKRLIAAAMYQLGTIYQDQGDYGRARDIYIQTMKIDKEFDNKSGIALTLYQLGNMYHRQNVYDQARDMYYQSMEIAKESDYGQGIPANLFQLGEIYRKQGDYDRAQEMYSQCLTIAEKAGNKSGIAASLGQMGQISEAKKQYKAALRNYMLAFAIFEELKSPDRDIVRGNMARLKKKIGEKEFETLWNEIVADQKE